MLAAPIRKQLSRCLAIYCLAFGVANFFSSCATQKPPPALVGDPDARQESNIPWNRPEHWESGVNVPGGIGGDTGGPGTSQIGGN